VQNRSLINEERKTGECNGLQGKKKGGRGGENSKKDPLFDQKKLAGRACQEGGDSGGPRTSNGAGVEEGRRVGKRDSRDSAAERKRGRTAANKQNASLIVRLSLVVEDKA